MHTTEDLVEGREELERILEGVKELPDDRREALIMRFALGMDNREIARAMGRTDGATKVLIHRAIKQLEEIVEAPTGSRAARRVVDVEAPAALGAGAGRAARGARRAAGGDARQLTELAAEELDAWELSAMRDPRNWVRPVAAATVGGPAPRS